MLDLKGISRFFAALGFAAALLLSTTPANAAYILQYDLTYGGSQNTEVVMNPRSFYIHDIFDSYSSLQWQIVSAEDDGQGGVFVQLDWIGGDGRNELDFFSAQGAIRIVPINGSSDVTPVIVDVWTTGEFYTEIVSTGLGGEDEAIGYADVWLDMQSGDCKLNCVTAHDWLTSEGGQHHGNNSGSKQAEGAGG